MTCLTCNDTGKVKVVGVKGTVVRECTDCYTAQHHRDHEAIIRDRAAGHLNDNDPWVVYRNGHRRRVFKTFEDACRWASEVSIMGNCTIRHYDRDTEEVPLIWIPPEKLGETTQTTTDTILAERNPTHGDFDTGSAIWQKIMNAVYKNGTARYTPSQQMALTMIAMKLSRIANGNPNFADHWDDIAGYANLESRQLKKEKTQ